MAVSVTVDPVDPGADSGILVVSQSNFQEPANSTDPALPPEHANIVAGPHATVRHCIYRTHADDTGTSEQAWRFAQKNANNSFGFDLALADHLGGNRAIMKWGMGGTASPAFKTKKAQIAAWFVDRIANYPGANGLRPDLLIICQGETSSGGSWSTWIADWAEVVAAVRAAVGRQRMRVRILQTSNEIGSSTQLRADQVTFAGQIGHGAITLTDTANEPFASSPHWGADQVAGPLAYRFAADVASDLAGM